MGLRFFSSGVEIFSGGLRNIRGGGSWEIFWGIGKFSGGGGCWEIFGGVEKFSGGWEIFGGLRNFRGGGRGWEIFGGWEISGGIEVREALRFFGRVEKFLGGSETFRKDWEISGGWEIWGDWEIFKEVEFFFWWVGVDIFSRGVGIFWEGWDLVRLFEVVSVMDKQFSRDRGKDVRIFQGDRNFSGSVLNSFWNWDFLVVTWGYFKGVENFSDGAKGFWRGWEFFKCRGWGFFMMFETFLGCWKWRFS